MHSTCIFAKLDQLDAILQNESDHGYGWNKNKKIPEHQKNGLPCTDIYARSHVVPRIPGN